MNSIDNLETGVNKTDAKHVLKSRSRSRGPTSSHQATQPYFPPFSQDLLDHSQLKQESVSIASTPHLMNCDLPSSLKQSARDEAVPQTGKDKAIEKTIKVLQERLADVQAENHKLH